MANTSSTKELFTQQNKQGKQGEQLVREYLEVRGYKVNDTSNNYGLHTDLQLTRVDGSIFTAEVKYDARMEKTGNLFLEHEILYVDRDMDKGWIHKTQADYIFYINAKTGRTYIFDWKKLKKLIVENPLNLSKKTCSDYINGCIYKYVDGYVVSPTDPRLKTALFGVINDIRN